VRGPFCAGWDSSSSRHSGNHKTTGKRKRMAAVATPKNSPCTCLLCSADASGVRGMKGHGVGGTAHGGDGHRIRDEERGGRSGATQNDAHVINVGSSPVVTRVRACVGVPSCACPVCRRLRRERQGPHWAGPSVHAPRAGVHMHIPLPPPSLHWCLCVLAVCVCLCVFPVRVFPLRPCFLLRRQSKGPLTADCSALLCGQLTQPDGSARCGHTDALRPWTAEARRDQPLAPSSCVPVPRLWEGAGGAGETRGTAVCRERGAPPQRHSAVALRIAGEPKQCACCAAGFP
jgi:hypothetical protein